MNIKILCIFGTRPEAIKMAPIITKLNQDPRFKLYLCTTGQHQALLAPVLSVFNIKPDFNLNVMAEHQGLNALSAKILVGLDAVLQDITPRYVLVHGDTTTSMSAAIAAFHHKIPIAHIEAGLRTHDMNAPWPEEGNRKLTAALATLHFAPTINAQDHLLKEGVLAKNIFVTGNTVIDALLAAANQLKNNPQLQLALQKKYAHLHLKKRMILVTGHRRENFGQGFQNICWALQCIATRFPDVDIVYPVHLNPAVIKPVNEFLKNIKNIHLIEPLDYLAFIHFMQSSYLILTDSGGIQEEAPSLNKPVLVMRDKTERPEGIATGAVRLIGTKVETIVSHVSQLLNNPDEYNRMAKAANPYGDGLASERIITTLAEHFAANHYTKSGEMATNS